MPKQLKPTFNNGNNTLKEFSDLMDELSRRHDVGRVFSDFLTMAICSFHQTNILSWFNQQDEDNERIYMDVIGSYEEDEIKVFPKLLGTLQAHVMDNPYSDVLGTYFTQQITKGQNGQFFTPDPICDFMAAITMDEEQMEGKRIMDPACGSGRMLLKAAKRSPANYFFGADNSNTCAKMAALNFFINGLRGEVAWMNSLSQEWYGGWQINNGGLGILPIEKEQSLIWNRPPPQRELNMPKPSGQGSQLTMF